MNPQVAQLETLLARVQRKRQEPRGQATQAAQTPQASQTPQAAQNAARTTIPADTRTTVSDTGSTQPFAKITEPAAAKPTSPRSIPTPAVTSPRRRPNTLFGAPTPSKPMPAARAPSSPKTTPQTIEHAPITASSAVVRVKGHAHPPKPVTFGTLIQRALSLRLR